MTIAEMIAEVPSVGCMVVTLAAYAADSAWRDLRKAECGRDRRSGTLRFAVPAIIGLIVIATIVLFFPAKPLSQDEVPNASYGAKNALIQVAINTVLVSPFVAWVIWRRKGAAALGLAKEDFLRSLAIGTCVSLACIVMLGRVSTVFWSSLGTWWLLVDQTISQRFENPMKEPRVLRAIPDDIYKRPNDWFFEKPIFVIKLGYLLEGK